MLQRVLQRSLTRPNLVKSLVKPASFRLFTANAIQCEESGTLKPTQGKTLLTFLLCRK